MVDDDNIHRHIFHFHQLQPELFLKCIEDVWKSTARIGSGLRSRRIAAATTSKQRHVGKHRCRKASATLTVEFQSKIVFRRQPGLIGDTRLSHVGVVS